MKNAPTRILLLITSAAMLSGLLSVPAEALDRQPTSPDSSQENDYTIHSSVEMVLLNVIVEGKNGGFVSGSSGMSG